MKTRHRQRDKTANMVGGKTITPEQKAAIDVLKDLYPTLNNNANCIDQITESCITTDFKSFLNRQVTKDMLPKGDNWSWNQSNARVNFVLNEEIAVIMYKLNPRKLMEGVKQPSYKLWIYLIYERENDDKGPQKFICSFIWCEKGEEKEISISDLAFLKDFMEPDVANLIFGRY